MTCEAMFGNFIIKLKSDNECRWVDEANKILNYKEGNYKEALQGLEILRRYKKITLTDIGMKQYKFVDSLIAEAFKDTSKW